MDQPLDPTNENVSYFHGAYDERVKGNVPWLTVLNAIASGKYQDKIQKARSIKDKKQYRSFKNTLPAVTFAGTFHEKRAIANTLQASGFIVADLDNLMHVEAIFGLFTEDPYVWFAFRSPSGKGIKVGFRAKGIQADTDIKRFFKAMKFYLRDTYGLEPDEACKNIDRLCYVSDDPNLYINDNPQYFDLENWSPARVTAAALPSPPPSTEENSGKHKYGQKVLESTCERIRQSEPGQQHAERLKQARLVGGFIETGYIDEHQALDHFEKAVADSGAKNMRASMKTVADGIAYGKLAPLYPEARVPAEIIESFTDIDPIDIFGDTSLAGSPEWSKEACPSAINDFAIDAAQRLGVDTPMVAMPAIICAAIAIPDSFRIQPKFYDTDWTEPAILWGGTIAPPGEKKSPAHDQATKVLKQIQFRYKDEFEAEFAIYEREKARYEALGKEEKIATEPPKKPVMRRKWIDDTTMESLRTALKNNPDGVGVIKDELSGFICGFDVYKNNNSGMGSKDASDACELFQGKPKVFDRMGGVIFVPNWGASILGTIQPEPIKKIAHKIAAGGLLARFLFWHGARVEETDRPPHICCETYYQVIKLLADLKPKNNSDKQIFKFNNDGIFYREQIRDICRTIMLMPDTSNPLKAHLNKWEAIFSRLCLVYHLVTAITEGKYPQDTVASQTAEMALRLMIDFLLPNIIRFYKETVDTDDHICDARWIAGHILERKPTKLSPRDIARAYRGLRKNQKELFATMDILDLAGWVDKEKNGKRIFWNINPKVHTKFAERAKTEIQCREDNKRKLQENIDKNRQERGQQ